MLSSGWVGGWLDIGLVEQQILLVLRIIRAGGWVGEGARAEASGKMARLYSVYTNNREWVGWHVAGRMHSKNSVQIPLAMTRIYFTGHQMASYV